MTARRGRWTHGDHPGLNPGWRLDGTNLVLDFDPLDGGDGAWRLWDNGTPGEAVDHYLDGAMQWVETQQSGRSVESS